MMASYLRCIIFSLRSVIFNEILQFGVLPAQEGKIGRKADFLFPPDDILTLEMTTTTT